MKRNLVLTVACLCQVLVVLDVSVVNVALPSVALDLGFSAGSLSWVVNAYTLVFGGLLLLCGRIADLLGHRRAMLSGLVLFGVASILGGLAQTPAELIAARAAQGVAGALLAPLSLTVIMVTFAEGVARSRAVGVWAMVAASDSALGVLLGGLLTEWLSWRWVFYVNVPIVLVAAALALAAGLRARSPERARLDIPGAIMATVAVTALVNGTIQAGEHGWDSGWALGSFAVALAVGAAFAWWETRVAAAPLVRFAIFRTRTVRVATLLVVFIGAATVAGFYFASLFLQDVLHYTPLEAGAAFLPFCAGTVVGSLASARLAARFGTRAVLTGGLLLGAAGMAGFGMLSAESTFAGGFLLPSLVASTGVGLCMVANTSLATTGVAPEDAGLVSGLVNAARQCGGSLGLAVLATVSVSAARGSGAIDPLEALVHGYERAFLVAGALVLAAAVLALVHVPRPAAVSRPEPVVAE